jgi:hypothetical protein
MENQTAFDLNRAIQNWRNDLGQSPAIDCDGIDELESHLRESVAALQTSGLTAEESFIVSARRIGWSSQIEAEFCKVNGDALWTDRVLWMMIAYQLSFAISSMPGLEWRTLSVILVASLFFRSVRNVLSRMLLKPFQLSAALFVVFVSVKILGVLTIISTPGFSRSRGNPDLLAYLANDFGNGQALALYFLSVIFVAAIEVRERKHLRAVRL